MGNGISGIGKMVISLLFGVFLGVIFTLELYSPNKVDYESKLHEYELRKGEKDKQIIALEKEIESINSNQNILRYEKMRMKSILDSSLKKIEALTNTIVTPQEIKNAREWIDLYNLSR